MRILSVSRPDVYHDEKSTVTGERSSLASLDLQISSVDVPGFPQLHRPARFTFSVHRPTLFAIAMFVDVCFRGLRVCVGDVLSSPQAISYRGWVSQIGYNRLVFFIDAAGRFSELAVFTGMLYANFNASAVIRCCHVVSNHGGRVTEL